MIRQIVHLPHPVLRQVSKPVTVFDDALQTLIDDMFETMYHARGVGLAAPQIGMSLQLSVIDVVGDQIKQIVLINPTIIHITGKVKCKEGCLSIPGVYEAVERAEQVTVRAQDRFGQSFDMTADLLLGQCFQHEIDHLNGKLFVDLLSPLKRVLARRRLEKFKRQD